MIVSSFDDERGRESHHDNELAEVVSVCLNGSKGIHAATIMCRNFTKAISENYIYSSGYPQLLNSLAKVQPVVFLNVFLAGDEAEDYQLQKMFIYNFERFATGAPLSWFEEPTFPVCSIASLPHPPVPRVDFLLTLT